MAARAAGLFHQMDLAQLHALIHGLAHIIDGQQRGGNAGQRFHLHAGHTTGFYGAQGFYRLPFGQQTELDARLGQGQRVAQRDQLTGALGGHDACNARHTQHIALFHGAALHGGKGLGVHGNNAVGSGFPGGDGLCAHVHHHGVAGGIKMCQIIFTHIFSP